MASAALAVVLRALVPAVFLPCRVKGAAMFDRGLDSPAALAIWLDGHVASTAVARPGCATLPHCRQATKFSQGLTLLGRRCRWPGRAALAGQAQQHKKVVLIGYPATGSPEAPETSDSAKA